MRVARRRWLLGAATGTLVDLAFGEPPLDPHPVAAFGSLMGAIERRVWTDARPHGVAYATAGLALGAGAGGLLRSVTAATALAVAGRGLADAAGEVHAALAAGDLPAARRALPALVGRDPSGLSEQEIARAVVESVAENTVDAVVAPALWAAAAGAPGALAYRAANTLDSCVGHHSPRYARFGWASARLDDAAGWAPARVTAALVAAVRPRRAAAVWRAVRHQAGHHPSPNAGVAEAAFAAALGVTLGGRNDYGHRVEVRPALGSGPPAGPGDIDGAVRLSRDVTVALAAALAAGALARRKRR
jgi:adenosylcobinamide-phosphate synthase